MDLADEALKMTGALATVVVLLMGGLFILKRLMGDSSANVGGPIVRLLGGLRLGQGKAIMLVEVAGEVLVLGSTARDLTLLSRVEDVERIEKLRAMSCGTVGQLGAWASGWWGGTRQHSLGIEGKTENS